MDAARIEWSGARECLSAVPVRSSSAAMPAASAVELIRSPTVTLSRCVCTPNTVSKTGRQVGNRVRLREDNKSAWRRDGA